MTNVMGTVNLLEAVRQAASVKVVVTVTSDKCYENKDRVVSHKEDESMGGDDPYSSSKGCVELVTAAYRKSFFSSNDFSQCNIALASARAGNVIGGGDWAEDRLLPDIVKGVLAKQKIKIRNPQAIRPWQHVLEPLSGYLTLAEKLWKEGHKYSEAWNFGPNEENDKPVIYIVETFLKLYGEKVDWSIDKEENKLHEANYLKLDCTKANTRLNWRAAWGIDASLEKTAEWYKAFKEKKDLEKITLSQIEQYEQSYLSV
jgi:CDP-glucose 4,6-dehydratase